jgi:alpha-galactosidase
MRVAVIGAGSAVWTRSVVCDFCLSPELGPVELALMDIDADRLGPVARLAERLIRDGRAPHTVTATTDRAEALRGADFVIISVSVGGVDGWQQDLDIPLRHGVFQTVGDTIGPGGVLRALRHIPALVEMARDVERICPNAWVIQLTNPMNPICRAMERASGARVLGLCHGVQGTEEDWAGMLGLPAERVRIYAYGNNHFLFVRAMWAGDRDGLALLRALPRDAWAPYEANYRLWEIYGMLPVNRPRHPVEFVRLFLAGGEQAAAGYGLDRVATDRHIARSRSAPDTASAEVASPEPLTLSRSREPVTDVIAALAGARELVTHVNVANRGAVPNLPAHGHIELPALLNGRGVFPLATDDLPAGIAAEVRRVIDEQELIVEAALTGSRRLALQALLADALTPSLAAAEAILSEAIAAQSPYLDHLR